MEERVLVSFEVTALKKLSVLSTMTLKVLGLDYSSDTWSLLHVVFKAFKIMNNKHKKTNELRNKRSRALAADLVGGSELLSSCELVRARRTQILKSNLLSLSSRSKFAIN